MPATLELDGQKFVDREHRIKVRVSASTWRTGRLFEAITNSVLPQFFALMDDVGSMVSLRNGRYAVIEDTI